jgi:lipopolysaccharide export system permease protein
MYLESEMTVLFACGVSDRQILGQTLLASTLVMAIVAAMSLWVSPWGRQEVVDIINQQRQATEFELLIPGRFQPLSSGKRVTYVEGLSDDRRELQGVFIAEFGDEDRGLSIITADAGVQRVAGENGERFLVLEKGTRFQGVPGQLDYQVTEFGAYGLRIEGADASERHEEEAVSTVALWSSDDPGQRALLHWRISLPLIVPIVTLLAVPLSRVNPRQGRFFHLLPAMLVYITYLGLLIVARNALAEQKVPQWIGMFWVHGLFLGLGLWLQFGPAWLQRRRRNREASRAQA